MQSLTKKQLLVLTQQTSFESLLNIMQTSDKHTKWAYSSKMLYLMTNSFLRNFQGQPLIDYFQNVRNLILRLPNKLNFGDSYVSMNLPVSTLDVQCNKQQFQKITQDIFLVMFDDPDFQLKELILDFQDMRTQPVSMQLLLKCLNVPVCQQDENGNDIRSYSLCKDTLYKLNYLKTNINIDDHFYKIFAEISTLKSLNLTVNNSLVRFQQQVAMQQLKTLQIKKSTISTREIAAILGSHSNLESFKVITSLLLGNKFPIRLVQQIQEQQQNTKAVDKQIKSQTSVQPPLIRNLRHLEIISVNEVEITFLLQLLQACNNLESFSFQGQISTLNASKIMIDVEALSKQKLQLFQQEQYQGKLAENEEKLLSVNDLVSGGSVQEATNYFDIDQFNKTFMEGKSLDKDFQIDALVANDYAQQNFQFLELQESDTSNVEDQYVHLNINPLKTPKIYAQMNQHFAKLYVDESTEDDGITTSISSQSDDGVEMGFQGSDIDEEMKLQDQFTQKKEKYKQHRKDSINYKLNRQNSILGNDLHYRFNISEQVQTNVDGQGIEQFMYQNDKNIIQESSDQNTVEVSYSDEHTEEMSITNSSSGLNPSSDSTQNHQSNKTDDTEDKVLDEVIEDQHIRNNSLIEKYKMRELANINTVDMEGHNNKKMDFELGTIDFLQQLSNINAQDMQSQSQNQKLSMTQFMQKNSIAENNQKPLEQVNFTDTTEIDANHLFSHNNIILNETSPLSNQRRMKNYASAVDIGIPTPKIIQYKKRETLNESYKSEESDIPHSPNDTVDAGETPEDTIEERHTQTIHQDNELLQMLLKAQGRMSEATGHKHNGRRPSLQREGRGARQSLAEIARGVGVEEKSQKQEKKTRSDRKTQGKLNLDIKQTTASIIANSRDGSQHGSEHSGRQMLASATLDLGASRSSRGSKGTKCSHNKVSKNNDIGICCGASGVSGASGTSGARALEVARWAQERAEFEAAVEEVKRARRCASLTIFSRGKQLVKLRTRGQQTLQTVYTNVMLKSDFTRIVSQRMNAFYKDEDENITFQMINQLVNNNVLEREDANKMTTKAIAKRFYDTNIAFQRFIPLDNAEFRLLQEFKYAKLSQLPIQDVNNYYERLQLFCKHELDLAFATPITQHITTVENLYNGKYESGARSRAVSLFSDSESAAIDFTDGPISGVSGATGTSGQGLVSFSVLGNPSALGVPSINDERLPMVPGPSGTSGVSSWQISYPGWQSAIMGHKGSFFSNNPTNYCQARANSIAIKQNETPDAKQVQVQETQQFVDVFYTALQLNLPKTIKHIDVPEMRLDNSGFFFLACGNLASIRCASISVSGKHLNNTLQQVTLLNAGLLNIKALSDALPNLKCLTLSQVVLEGTANLKKMKLETLEISDSVHVSSATIREVLDSTAENLIHLILRNTYLPSISNSDQPLKSLQILECHNIYTKPPNQRHVYYPISSTILEFLAMQRNLPGLLRSSYSSNPYKYTPLYTVDVSLLYNLYADLSQIKTKSVQIFFRYFQAKEVLQDQIKRQGINNIYLYE